MTSREGKFPPPTDGPERRAAYRREDDQEKQTIIDHAVEDAPIVRRLLHTSKVAGAIGVLGAVIGAVAAMLGVRLVGPHTDVESLARIVSVRADTNAARIARQGERLDSLISVMADMHSDIQTMTYIQCVELRRNNPDLRPPGCDASVPRVRP